MAKRGTFDFVYDQNQTILCRSRAERKFLKRWSLCNVGSGLYRVFTIEKRALSFQQKRAFIQEIHFSFFKCAHMHAPIALPRTLAMNVRMRVLVLKNIRNSSTTLLVHIHQKQKIALEISAKIASVIEPLIFMHVEDYSEDCNYRYYVIFLCVLSVTPVF